MFGSAEQSVIIPPDAAQKARLALGLSPSDPLRIAFVAGPGDVVGTFNCWQQGTHDPRTPVIAYSEMFYSLVSALDASALLLVEQDKQPEKPDPRFRFIFTARRRGRRGIGYRLDERAFAKNALRHLHAYHADVILVGTDAPDSLIANLPPARRIILTAHNAFWPMGKRKTSLKSRLGYFMKSRALRRIDSVVNTSSECASQVAALGGPSGPRSFTEVPQIHQSSYPKEVSVPSEIRRLLFVGRMEEDKGVFDVLEAFNAVAKDHSELQLEFVGTGSADRQLQSAIAASPHVDRIVFRGQLLARSVHERLDAADLLICPTRSSFKEGLALVVVEAAVHGVPTLLSSVVPAKALFPDCCVEFPADKIPELKEALSRLINNPTDYRSLCAELARHRAKFLDRSKSWGSLLYSTLTV